MSPPLNLAKTDYERGVDPAIIDAWKSHHAHIEAERAKKSAAWRELEARFKAAGFDGEAGYKHPVARAMFNVRDIAAAREVLKSILPADLGPVAQVARQMLLLVQALGQRPEGPDRLSGPDALHSQLDKLSLSGARAHLPNMLAVFSALAQVEGGSGRDIMKSALQLKTPEQVDELVNKIFLGGVSAAATEHRSAELVLASYERQLRIKATSIEAQYKADFDHFGATDLITLDQEENTYERETGRAAKENMERAADPVRAESFRALKKRVAELDLSGISGEGETYPLNRTFGAEIEFYLGDPMAGEQAREVVTLLLQRLGVVITGGKDYSGWSVVKESTVRGESVFEQEGGVEIVSPVLKGEEGQREYRRVMQALRLIGAKTNNTCGAHFHIGAMDLVGNHLGQKALIRNVAANEPAITRFVPLHRTQGGYGGKSFAAIAGQSHAAGMQALEQVLQKPEPDPNAAITGVADELVATGKQSQINLGYLATGQATVESRRLEGSLDADRCLNWLAMHMHLVDLAVSAPDQVPQFNIQQEENGPRLRFKGLVLATDLFADEGKPQEKNKPRPKKAQLVAS